VWVPTALSLLLASVTLEITNLAAVILVLLGLLGLIGLLGFFYCEQARKMDWFELLLYACMQVV
jgi:hypothetical protein